jgi:hypothetical protein
VLKVFEYLSMGLEAILQLKASKSVPESEAVPVIAYDAHAARAELQQVVVASPTSSAVPLPGQIVDN